MKARERVFWLSFFIALIVISGAVLLMLCLNNINKTTTQGEFVLFTASMKSKDIIEWQALNNNFFINKNPIDDIFKQIERVRLAIPAPARAVITGVKELSNALFTWVYGFL